MGHSQTRSRLAIVARLSLASGLVAVGACSVGPTFTRPQAALPAAWQAANNPHLAANAAADALWWKGFNDPVLDRLVELARRQNLPLQVAGLRIVEARAQWGIATGRQFPQVQEITGSATAAGPSKNTPLGAILPRHLTDYQIGFDASWEIDFWGKYRRAVDAEAASLAGVGRRLRRRRGVADRRGRADLRRRAHRRGADRAGAQQRRHPGPGAEDRAVAFSERRDVGAGRRPGHDAAAEHARDDPRCCRASCSRRATR